MSRKRAVRNITEAGMSHAQDVHDRTVRYLVSMSIRMACFFLAVLTPSPWRWMFAIGAIVLPWVAVLIANAGKEHGPPDQTSVIEHAPFAALGPGRAVPAPDAAPAGPAAADPSEPPSDAASNAAAASGAGPGTASAPEEADDSGADASIIDPDPGSAQRSGAEDNGPDGEEPEIIIGELDADDERKND